MFLRFGCGAADLDLTLARGLLFKKEKLVRETRYNKQDLYRNSRKSEIIRKEERARGEGTCEFSFENRNDSFVNFDAAVLEEPENRSGKIKIRPNNKPG